MPHSEASPGSAPIFELKDLVVGFSQGGRSVNAVRGISYEVHDGETVGIVGESGSGKSVSLLGAFGLLPGSGRLVSGSALLEGRNLGAMSTDEKRRLLGSKAAFVFQNPMSALNPVLTIGDQIGECITLHNPAMRGAAVRKRVIALLTAVGITEPERRSRQYPHEFSGGMCQRAMIAMALANNPRLLIADEPTTAVDVTTQAQILELLRKLRTEFNGGVILVSHDLGVISENTHRVVVMYAGEIMETGATEAVLHRPQHPYTQGLLACRPSLGTPHLLVPIAGQPPRVSDPISGCPFAPRCPIGRDDDRCRSEKPALVASSDSLAACHYPGGDAFGGASAALDKTPATDDQPLIRLSNINVDYPAGRGFFGGRTMVRAVHDASIEVRRGSALGIVGESGSGKSTLARVMMRLTDASNGRIEFDGADITRLTRRGLRSFRDRVQMVFQDPFNSLAPHLTVGQNVAEPLRIRGIAPADRREQVLRRFDEVGLLPDHYDRPLEALSGGQLQRAGIARALVLDPDVLVMDEPVSALDVSIQAQILNLLIDLKARRNLGYAFISHDMSVVRYLCDQLVVMKDGVIVEAGATEAIFANPAHEYTRTLLAAIPETAAH